MAFFKHCEFLSSPACSLTLSLSRSRSLRSWLFCDLRCKRSWQKCAPSEPRQRNPSPGHRGNAKFSFANIGACLVCGAVMASNTNAADSCHDNISLNGDSNNKCVSKNLELGRFSCLNRTARIVPGSACRATGLQERRGGVGDEEGGLRIATLAKICGDCGDS